MIELGDRQRDILRRVAWNSPQGEFTISELARQSNVDQTTVFKSCATLLEERLLLLSDAERKGAPRMLSITDKGVICAFKSGLDYESWLAKHGGTADRQLFELVRSLVKTKEGRNVIFSGLFDFFINNNVFDNSGGNLWTKSDYWKKQSILQVLMVAARLKREDPALMNDGGFEKLVKEAKTKVGARMVEAALDAS